MHDDFVVIGDDTKYASNLHEADIGLAIGVVGIRKTKESADMIILDDNISIIVIVSKWGRSVFINIQKIVQFQLTVNVVSLIVKL
jgi:Ca2+-transporting ATPase